MRRFEQNNGSQEDLINWANKEETLLAHNKGSNTGVKITKTMYDILKSHHYYELKFKESYNEDKNFITIIKEERYVNPTPEKALTEEEKQELAVMYIRFKNMILDFSKEEKPMNNEFLTTIHRNIITIALSLGLVIDNLFGDGQKAAIALFPTIALIGILINVAFNIKLPKAFKELEVEEALIFRDNKSK